MNRRKQPGRRLPAPAAPERAPAPAPEPELESDEVDNLLYVLNDQLRRTDAFATSAERELVESWGLEGDDSDDNEDGGVQRRRMRVEYLVEAAKLEVRAAQYTSDQIAAELTRRGGAA